MYYVFLCHVCVSLMIVLRRLLLFQSTCPLPWYLQMLDRGFKDQIYEIFSCGLPKDTQVRLRQPFRFARQPVTVSVCHAGCAL